MVRDTLEKLEKYNKDVDFRKVITECADEYKKIIS